MGCKGGSDAPDAHDQVEDGRATKELSVVEGGFATPDNGGGEVDIVAHGEDIAVTKPMGDGGTTRELSGGKVG